MTFLQMLLFLCVSQWAWRVPQEPARSRARFPRSWR